MMTIRYAAAAAVVAFAVNMIAGADEALLQPPDESGITQVEAGQMMPFASLLNELSERRRRVVYTPNPVSLFDGATLGLVQLGAGNLSMRRRDLVTFDPLPIVASRIYDSRDRSEGDFGASGWRLSLAARLIVSADRAVLETPDGARMVLRKTRDGFAPALPQPSAIVAISNLAGGRVSLSYRDGGHLVFASAGEAGTFLLVERTDRFGHSQQFLWDADQRLQSVRGAHSRIDIGRDAGGLIRSLRDESGREILYDYDSDNRLWQVTDPAGNVWRYEYDADGRLRRAVGPEGGENVLAVYDGSGRVSRLARNGRALDYRYDLRPRQFGGLRVTAVAEAGASTRYFGHSPGGVTVLAARAGIATTRVDLDDRNRPRRLLHNGETLAEFAFDADGRLSRLVHKVHGTLEYRYSDDGLLSLVRHAAGDSLAAVDRDASGNVNVRLGDMAYRYRLDSEGLLASAAYGNGDPFLFESDQRGRFVRVQEGGERQLHLSYNSAGRLASVRFPDGQTHDYDYDPLGLRTATGVTTGASARYSYAGDGRMTRYSLTDPAGTTRTTVHRTDNENRLAAVDAAGQTFEIAYGPADRALHMTADSGRLSFFYDSIGRFVGVSDGNSTWRYSYAPGEIDLVVRADNRRWPAVYDAVNVAWPVSALYAEHYLRQEPAYLGLLHVDTQQATIRLTHALAVALPGERLRSMLQALNLISVSGDALAGGEGADARISFNAPSNFFFVPAEYWSLNCIFCFGQDPYYVTPSRSPTNAWPTLALLADSTEPGCYLNPNIPHPPECELEVSGLPHYMCIGNQAAIGATLTPDHLDEVHINWTSNERLTLLPAGASGRQVTILAGSAGGDPVNASGAVAASYDRLGVACADAQVVPVIANRQTEYAAIIDTDQCPERQQDTSRAYNIDGCSIPPVMSFLTFSGNVQDPIGGDHHAPGHPTTFGTPQGQLAYGQAPADLPCNHHDVCYQTCGHNRLGCDNNFLQDMGAVCEQAYPDTCPFGFASPSCGFFEIEKIECGLGRNAMFQAVRLSGAIAYRERQVEHCQCCPAD